MDKHWANRAPLVSRAIPGFFWHVEFLRFTLGSRLQIVRCEVGCLTSHSHSDSETLSFQTWNGSAGLKCVTLCLSYWRRRSSAVFGTKRQIVKVYSPKDCQGWQVMGAEEPFCLHVELSLRLSVTLLLHSLSQHCAWIRPGNWVNHK